MKKTVKSGDVLIYETDDKGITIGCGPMGCLLIVLAVVLLVSCGSAVL